MFVLYTCLQTSKRDVLRNTQLIEHFLNVYNFKFKTIDISSLAIKPFFLRTYIDYPVLTIQQHIIGNYKYLQELEDSKQLESYLHILLLI